MEKEIICVVCPSSCRVSVKGEGDKIESITGFGCKRGKEYATNEFIAPVRMLSTTVRAEGYVSPVIAVRSNKPIPKELQFKCMDLIRATTVKAPFEMERVVLEDVLGTGVDIVLANC